MKYLPVILLLLGRLLASHPGIAAESPPPPARIAVYIHPLKADHADRREMQNIESSLRHHLDYLLWSRGWSPMPIGDGQTIESEILARRCRAEGYRGLLYLRLGAKYQLRSIPGEKNAFYEYIRLQIKMKYFQLDTEIDSVITADFQAATSSDWLNAIDSVDPAARYEPPDFVIKRLLSENLKFIPGHENEAPLPSSSVPVILALDSRIHNDWHTGGDSTVLKALEYASRSLQRQFGFGLQITGIEYFTSKATPFSDIENLFKSFQGLERARPETLVVGVFRPENGRDFYARNRDAQIGISDLGRQTSLVAALDSPTPELNEWNVFITGQLLLHEIGHLLGAIHVSDINSLMTIITEWTASDKFDPLNTAIIEAGRKDKSRLTTVAGYLDLLAETLEQTDYKLSDYPSLFFSYMNLNRPGIMGDEFQRTPFRAAISSAARGYMQYRLKNNAFASSLFYRALADNPDQGALHYYLSKVTFNELSKFHLRRAAEIGYNDAIREIEQERN